MSVKCAIPDVPIASVQNSPITMLSVVVSPERQRLKGFYRAFMSTSTQWLSNLFAGICVNARVVNMHVSHSLLSDHELEFP